MNRLAINCFGRIDRIAFREMITSRDFDIVAINSTKEASELAYLLKYDIVHRAFHISEIEGINHEIIITGKKYNKMLTEKDPKYLPWCYLNIDLVLECTGLLIKEEDARKHIMAGDKKVLISALGKE